MYQDSKGKASRSSIDNGEDKQIATALWLTHISQPEYVPDQASSTFSWYSEGCAALGLMQGEYYHALHAAAHVLKASPSSQIRAGMYMNSSVLNHK